MRFYVICNRNVGSCDSMKRCLPAILCLFSPGPNLSILVKQQKHTNTQTDKIINNNNNNNA